MGWRSRCTGSWLHLIDEIPSARIPWGRSCGRGAKWDPLGSVYPHLVLCAIEITLLFLQPVRICTSSAPVPTYSHLLFRSFNRSRCRFRGFGPSSSFIRPMRRVQTIIHRAIQTELLLYARKLPAGATFTSELLITAFLERVVRSLYFLHSTLY